MVLYTVRQIQGESEWAICRMGFALFKGLRLGPAIELARTVARDEHQRNHGPILVEFHNLSSVIPLASFD